MFGWLALVFAILAVLRSGFQFWQDGVWISSASISSSLFCVLNLYLYGKYSKRAAVLEALDALPNQSLDPVPAPGTPPAGQEARHG